MNPAERALLAANAAALGLPNVRTAPPIDLSGAETRLAAYGTLRPGQANAAVLERIDGVWRAGRTVAGRRAPDGWDDGAGFPGLIWGVGDAVNAVDVFQSDALPAHWPQLDDFEGEDYVRLYALIWRHGLPDGVAYIYAARALSIASICTLLAR
jgi:gamma-glutamylcyclotransferase (GGCT)/AIG2-like uncharacterized protein YtfP